MKKKFNKKLLFRKETVSTLTDKNMDKIRGGTVFFDCTESCTVFFVCCDTKTIPLEKNLVPAKGPG